MAPKTAFAFCVLLLLCAGCLEAPQESAFPESTVTPEPESTPIIIDSVDLALEFDDNELAAEAKYEGQVLEVSGVILDITEIGGKPYVKLDGLDEYGFSCVMCEFSSDTESQLYPLMKYDWATIRGTYSSYTMSRVKLEGCELVSVEK